MQIQGYDLRARATDHVIFKGPLQRVGTGAPDKAWAGLSAVADFMRLDITAGFITKNATQMSEGSGAAGMSDLQYRVMERVLGHRPIIVYSDMRTPIDTLYIPRTPELGRMHTDILARIGA